MKTTFFPLTAALLTLSVSLSATLQAQSAGTYRLLAAETKGDGKGYCSVGTVVIKTDKSVQLKSKNPLESNTTTFTGKAKLDGPFELTAPGKKKLRIRIINYGTKYIYGYYTAFVGKQEVGSGEYSMTRK